MAIESGLKEIVTCYCRLDTPESLCSPLKMLLLHPFLTQYGGAMVAYILLFITELAQTVERLTSIAKESAGGLEWALSTR
eukprot:7971165-Pyramimonas_sp.AAC.1